MAAPFATNRPRQLTRRLMKIRTALIAASAALLALTGCSSATPHAGTVTDAAQQGTSRMYSIEVSRVTYTCSAVYEPVCALLKRGDAVSFTTTGSSTWMEDVARTAAANA